MLLPVRIEIVFDKLLEGERAVLKVLIQVDLGVIVEKLYQLWHRGLEFLGVSQVGNDLLDLRIQLLEGLSIRLGR